MGQTASSEQERSDVRDVLKRRLGADAAAEFNDCDLDKLVRGGFHNDVTVAGAKYQAVRDVGLKPALCSLILTGGQEAVERKHAKPDGAREGFPINTKAPLYSHLLARTLNMTAPYEQYMFWYACGVTLFQLGKGRQNLSRARELGRAYAAKRQNKPDEVVQLHLANADAPENQLLRVAAFGREQKAAAAARFVVAAASPLLWAALVSYRRNQRLQDAAQQQPQHRH